MQVLCSLKFTKCPTGTFWLKLVAITRRIAPEVWEEKLLSTLVISDDDAMAHPMEPEYVMIESVRDAQPDVEDGTTISSPGMESLDAASVMRRRKEREA